MNFCKENIKNKQELNSLNLTKKGSKCGKNHILILKVKQLTEI